MRQSVTRRGLLMRSLFAGAALSVPFIHQRYARAASGIDPAAVKKFGASLKGRLILPSDKDYESARRVWNWRYDKHPAMVARCANSEDVGRCVGLARAKELVVAVRSGSH